MTTRIGLCKARIAVVTILAGLLSFAVGGVREARMTLEAIEPVVDTDDTPA